MKNITLKSNLDKTAQQSSKLVGTDSLFFHDQQNLGREIHIQSYSVFMTSEQGEDLTFQQKFKCLSGLCSLST